MSNIGNWASCLMIRELELLVLKGNRDDPVFGVGHYVILRLAWLPNQHIRTELVHHHSMLYPDGNSVLLSDGMIGFLERPTTQSLLESAPLAVCVDSSSSQLYSFENLRDKAQISAPSSMAPLCMQRLDLEVAGV